MAVKKIREGVYFPKVSYGRKVKNVISPVSVLLETLSQAHTLKTTIVGWPKIVVLFLRQIKFLRWFCLYLYRNEVVNNFSNPV